MARGKEPRGVMVDRLTDVGEWGDKDCHSGMYSRPLNIAGEQVDIDSLPAFGDSGGKDPDIDPGARAPLLPPGSL